MDSKVLIVDKCFHQIKSSHHKILDMFNSNFENVFVTLTIVGVCLNSWIKKTFDCPETFSLTAQSSRFVIGKTVQKY